VEAHSTVILPPPTNVVHGATFPLRVQKGTAGVEGNSDILVDQTLAWDNSLFRRELEVLPDGLREELKAALREFLDLRP
jgi:hypothetical protein